MRNVFSIDTSSRFCSLAILHGENLLSEVSFQPQNDLSSILIPEVDKILKEAGCALSQIGLVGVSIGPGLFTGIRIGMASVKGLFFDRECPMVPISTMTALVLKSSGFSGHIVPVVDAKKNDVYWGIYKYEEDKVKEFVSPKLTTVSEMQRELKSWSNLQFSGSGVTVHRKTLEENFPLESLHDTDPFLAVSIGKMAYREFQSGRFITDIGKLKPSYLREALPG